MISREWGEIAQLSGLIFLVIGIAIECILFAPIGFIIITAGSLFFAIGTKIKHRGNK